MNSITRPSMHVGSFRNALFRCCSCERLRKSHGDSPGNAPGRHRESGSTARSARCGRSLEESSHL